MIPNNLDRREVFLPDFLLILLVPAAAILINNNLLFSNQGANPWTALGFYHHLRGAPDFLLTENRQFGRLPSLLPGYLFYHLLPPMAANVAKYFFFTGVAITGAFYAMVREYGHRAAFLTTLLLAVHPFFLGTFSNDHYGNGVLAYSFASLACAIGAREAMTRRRKHGLLVWSGFFLGSAFFSHPISIFLLIFIPLMFFRQGTPGLGRLDTRARLFYRDVVTLGVWMFAGLIACIAAYATVNRLVFGGSVFFFEMDLRAIFLIDYGYWKERKPLSAGNVSLAVSMIAFFGVLIVLWTERNRPLLSWPAYSAYRTEIAFGLWFLVSLLLSYAGAFFYEWGHYNQWIVFPSVLVTGSILTRALPSMPSRWDYPVAATIVVLGLTFLALPNPVWQQRLFGTDITFIPIAMAVAAFVILLDWHRRSGTPLRHAALRVALASILLVTAQAGIRAKTVFTLPWSNGDDGTGRARYARIYDVMGFIDSLGWKRVPKMWIAISQGTDEYPKGIEILDRVNLMFVYLAHANAHNPPRSLIDFPRLTDGFFEPGDDVLIIDGKGDGAARATRALKPHGLAFIEAARHTVSKRGVTHYLSFGVIAKISSP